MNFPNDLKYSKTHEWVKFEDETTACIGITDYAQDQLGDLVFVNLPAEGNAAECGKAFADVESVKTVSDVISPVSGTITKVNEELADAPEMMNQAPYDAWFVVVSDITEVEELMDAAEYESFIQENE